MTINGKSMLGLLSLGKLSGREMTLLAEGADEERAAETLAADFPYARIDLFYCGGKVYFGEITFYHGGAFERFDPPEFDRFFGDKLALPRG